MTRTPLEKATEFRARHQEPRILVLPNAWDPATARIFASLGAEVIAVEPPKGVSTRGLSPFVDDRPHPNSSLTHWAYNRGKRSITAELGTEEGRAHLLDLIASADQRTTDTATSLRYTERFPFFLAAGLILIAIDLLVIPTRTRRIPT